MSETPEEIRARIDRTRENVSSDVDALAEKVSPSGIVGRETERVKGKVNAVKDRLFGSDDNDPGAVGHVGEDVRGAVGHAGESVRDAVGNELRDGDSVTVIKDLKVKGSSSVVKVGTKVRNIRLVDGDHDIDCKVPGIGQMGLKSEFVKKVQE